MGSISQQVQFLAACCDEALYPANRSPNVIHIVFYTDLNATQNAICKTCRTRF
jgi:hypothetical protein